MNYLSTKLTYPILYKQSSQNLLIYLLILFLNNSTLKEFLISMKYHVSNFRYKTC